MNVLLFALAALVTVLVATAAILVLFWLVLEAGKVVLAVLAMWKYG